jgi:hypothetical protein
MPIVQIASASRVFGTLGSKVAFDLLGSVKLKLMDVQSQLLLLGVQFAWRCWYISMMFLPSELN